MSQIRYIMKAVLPILAKQENLEEPHVDSDTSKEQEATTESLTWSKNEHDVSKEEIHAEQVQNPIFDEIQWANWGTPKFFGFRKEILYPESQLWKRESTGDPFHLREGSR